MKIGVIKIEAKMLPITLKKCNFKILIILNILVEKSECTYVKLFFGPRDLWWWLWVRRSLKIMCIQGWDVWGTVKYEWVTESWKSHQFSRFSSTCDGEGCKQHSRWWDGWFTESGLKLSMLKYVQRIYARKNPRFFHHDHTLFRLIYIYLLHLHSCID